MTYELEQPADSMADLRAESIKDFRPAGVEFVKAIELPADGAIEWMNRIQWSFRGTGLEAINAAGQAIRNAALADGWVAEFPGADVLGQASGASVQSARLSKAEISLGIRVVPQGSIPSALYPAVTAYMEVMGVQK